MPINVGHKEEEKSLSVNCEIQIIVKVHANALGFIAGHTMWNVTVTAPTPTEAEKHSALQFCQHIYIWNEICHNPWKTNNRESPDNKLYEKLYWKLWKSY